ncbi:hypothetical protein MPOCJGCO_2188 [Methylobacterium trifolii]|uniref:Transposase n=1 Tax=Methylobacterium trifolii TaxID=1003092 RepID=A0ABQ4TZB3_9HYPH|nr:hypothetical protein MPOCJGCO_2188 [Methylobacterium trifolii]
MIRAQLPAGTPIELWWQDALRHVQDEAVWQFLRDNWLGDRIFASYDDIIERCRDAWTRLIAQPWKIMSIGLRHWTYRL